MTMQPQRAAKTGAVLLLQRAQPGATREATRPLRPPERRAERWRAERSAAAAGARSSGRERERACREVRASSDHRQRRQLLRLLSLPATQRATAAAAAERKQSARMK